MTNLPMPALILGAFLAGVIAAGGASVAYSYSAGTQSTPHKAGAAYAKINAAQAQCPVVARPGVVKLPAVVADEFEEALAAIKFGTEEERGWRRQLASGKRRLLWLTLWDWDAQGESDTDTIQIRSGEYTRSIKLSASRQRIPVPEPISGYIQIEGQETTDGIIAVSILNGAEPIAIPRMRKGEKITLDLD